MNEKNHYDVVIIGAGAAGLMCAIRLGQRGLRTLVLEKTQTIAQKIRISGGGRCNFTNLDIQPQAYLSPNPHFCKSALARYTQWHFIEWIQQHGLTYHEKTLGQLFCDQKSTAIVQMLIDEAQQNHVEIRTEQAVTNIQYQPSQYCIQTQTNVFISKHLVIASGGPSIPKIGASDFALTVAKQFGIKNTPFKPALVPLKLPELILQQCRPLAGISLPVTIRCQHQVFSEHLLFTHRGLSGPAVLQISSYWQHGDLLTINLCPTTTMKTALITAKTTHPQQPLSQALARYLPNKLANAFVTWFFDDKVLQHYSDKQLCEIAEMLHHWQVKPSGSEGMKKAEVSTGGIAPDALSSKTFECKTQPGLYFIGEAVDVTGWLGGYNFQWAWSSGWCCGEAIALTNELSHPW